MITPPPLTKGDTIGITAPARKIMKKELDPFIRWANAEGFNIRLGRYIFKEDHQFAGTDYQRLSDLEMMIKEREVKAIISARGGYGCGRLLEGLNFRLLSENPKWLAGFSDVTALLGAYNRIAGVETLHSWMPYSLFTFNDFNRESLNSFKEAMSLKQLRYRIKPGSMSIEGMIRGRLTGGNLSVLYSLAGTPYEPDYEGKVLFIEDVDEYLYHIDRMIMNFELRGIFQQITGLIVGSFSKMNDNEIPFGKQAYEIIGERASKYNIPTLFGFPAGHENLNHALIFGRDVTLTIKKSEAILEF